VGFRDIFQQKLRGEREKAVAQEAVRVEAAAVRSGIQAEAEPLLRELVGEVFAELQSARWPRVTVTTGYPAQPTGLTAYALSPFGPTATGSGRYARALVIDSEGRIVLSHSVATVGDGADRIATHCEHLGTGYEELLRRIVRTDDPQGAGIYLSTAGTLMFSTMAGMDSSDVALYRTELLEEYLARRAAQTLAGT
jgi:hypothetical protein